MYRYRYRTTNGDIIFPQPRQLDEKSNSKERMHINFPPPYGTVLVLVTVPISITSTVTNHTTYVRSIVLSLHSK